MQRLVIDSRQKQGETLTLTPQQDHYLRRVLRLGIGDRFIALDGEGQGWIVTLWGIDAQILEPLPLLSSELPVQITLMVGLPKGQGFDEIIRYCTELGVTTFVPIISHRTLLQPSVKKVERWRRISQEAAEQSERLWVPKILDPVPFSQALSHLSPAQPRYICVARGNYPLLPTCFPSSPPSEISIATGPEGGWTEEEVNTAIIQGFQPVSLGKRILRAITAPIFVLSVLSATFENSLANQ